MKNKTHSELNRNLRTLRLPAMLDGGAPHL